MRIAILGAAGQLGSELVERYGEQAVPLDHATAELTSAASLERALATSAPDAVINCAAYNLVDQAESEPAVAFAVNACGPRDLARICHRRGIPLLHVSTDYVFGLDQRQAPYREEDLPGPLGVYGASKLAGEALVRCETPRHIIVRTCGLYGRPSPRGKGNFVQTILKLAAEREELRVVNDQRCTPTSASDLADALVPLLASERWGTYHATNSGDCSWFELASAIVAIRGLPVRLLPTTTAEFPRPARRPAYSVLAGDKLAHLLGRPLRPWRAALEAYLARLPG